MGGIPQSGTNMEGLHDMSNADDESQSGPNMEGLQDISNPYDAAQYAGLPDLEDVSTPPDGASGPSIASGPKTGDSSLVLCAATEEEQKQRHADIDKQAEIDRSFEEKQQLAEEELQRKQDRRQIEAKQKDEEDEARRKKERAEAEQNETIQKLLQTHKN